MYGIVNRAIEDLVTESFGLDKWNKIKERSQIDVDFFISNEPYDDSVTYKLARAASEEMEIPLSEVLHSFGEWWVLRTSKEKYGALMAAGGNNLRQFLINLPKFHNRVMLMYPKLTPPEFKVSRITDKSLDIHYFSQREGLQDFVMGLISGLVKMYQDNATFELIQSRNTGADHEVFRITWPS